MAIQLKSLDQLKLMRAAGLVVGETLQLMKAAVADGITTNDLDQIAVANLKKHGATPSFLNYHGFPKVICASVNDEIVHGIPGDRTLKTGDVISIDFGAIVKGFHGDAAITVGVGAISPEDQKMSDVCEESMWRGIAAGKVGGHLTAFQRQLGTTSIRRAHTEFCANTAATASVPKCIWSHMFLTSAKAATAQNSKSEWR